jgi:anaerobic magnesium-protoporphyrin IX monomethyl ester cyclase
MKDKAILINVGFDYPRYEEHLRVSPPLGILSLGTYLLQHDVPVELIDVQVDFGFGLTAAAQRVVCQRVARYLQGQADAIAWVGLSELSNSASGVMLAEEIRAVLPETPIVIGGYFPSSNYELLLRKYPTITAIVRGDGEAAALEISRSLAQGESFLSDQTPNLAWLDDGTLHTTPLRPVKLASLPTLDFRLLLNKSYYPVLNIMTSRGCPYRCNFCLESGMRPYAVYPAEWVARQLEHLENEMPNTHVILYDAIFGVGRERTREMCRAIGNRRFTYGTESRVDVLAPDMMAPLHAAGLEIIYWGIESASPATLMRMDKVRSEAEAKSYLNDTRAVLQACFENNIVSMLGFVLGFPGDTEADLQATLQFATEMRQLHDQIAAQTGTEAGFVPFAQSTAIYAGSPLAGRVANEFPGVVLQPTSFDGEINVIASSPGLGLDEIGHYEDEINGLGNYTPKVMELLDYYSSFAPKDFVAAHPELTDDQGVTALSADLRHFPCG